MEDSPALYRHVIADAWRLAWRHKFLWVYGFFAAMLATGGIYDVLLRSWNDATARQILRSLPRAADLPSLTELVGRALRPGELVLPPAWTVILILFVIIAAAALLWAAVISQGALVAAGAAMKGGRAPDPQSVFRTGLSHFWPVLGVNIVSKILVSLSLLLTALPVGRLLTEESPRAALLYILSFLVFIPVALTVSLLTIYAVAAIVIRGEPLHRAVAIAWQTFSRHWLVSLEMAFVILAIDVLFAVALALGVFLLMVPFTVLFLMVQLVGTKVSFFLVMTLAAIALLGFIIAAASFITTFRYAAWTMLYLRLEERGGLSKIVRFFHAIPKYLSR